MQQVKKFDASMLGFKHFSIKRSNTSGRLYHIRYAGRPLFEAFEVSLGYKVKINIVGHEKTYPHFTFELTFSISQGAIEVDLFGNSSSPERTVNIFDGNHNKFLNDKAYKRLIEVVRIWSLELNSKFADDFTGEYAFTGNILILSSDQKVPIQDYIKIMGKFNIGKYTPSERSEFYTCIKEIKIDELLLQYRHEKAVEEFGEMLRRGEKSEGEWQKFFECNTWMFGFGLNYIWVEGFQNRKLEQITTGSDITKAGKRPDAFLKTQADISTTVFVEIKTPLTQLVTKYRPDTWSAAPDLSGGVSQIQKTIASWMEKNTGEFKLRDDDGDLTGEVAFSYKPRGILIIGKFDQFKNDNGVNTPKLQGFELFRRSIDNIEIITFDEFFERVKRIVLRTVISSS